MKIGFTTNKKNIPQLESLCQQVLYIPQETMTAQELLTVVTDNPLAELVICSFEDLGLQLIQTYPALNYLKKHDRHINFINMPAYSDKNNDFLLQLAKSEKKLMSKRAKLSVEATVAAGKSRSRKRLSPDIVDKIQQLHQDKRTIREIAAICHVSLGTVFNYTRNLD